MKYSIYDNKSTVITPIGEELSSEEWLARYPWGKRAKMIVGGGIINGTVALVFDDYVETMRKIGCDFSTCETDEDYLKTIENFEDQMQQTSIIDNNERIANALEDLIVINMPDTE